MIPATPAAGLDPCARGFDRLAPVWDLLATGLSGGAIQRSQTRFLADVRDARHALVVGGGTGGFLVALLAACAATRVVALDPSPAMLRRTAARVAARAPAAAGRVEYRCGTVEDVRDDERYDLVCTHFVLDLFTPARLEVVMRRLDAVLERDGTWLCADFAPPEGPMLRRLAQRALLAGLYGAFGAACAVEARRLPPIGPAFERLGYRPERQAGGAAGLLHTAIWRRAGGTS